MNVGLETLKETVVKVEELRTCLASTRLQLTVKTQEANEKLKVMVAGQQEAEVKKDVSTQIQIQLQQQNLEIDTRRKQVMMELEMAEPAVLEAQKSVGAIKKQQLTEVRAMGNPPAPVKLAMESVCTVSELVLV